MFQNIALYSALKQFQSSIFLFINSLKLMLIEGKALIKTVLLLFVYFITLSESKLFDWVVSQKQNAGLPASIQIFRLNNTNTTFQTKVTGVMTKFDFKDNNLEFKVAFSEDQQLKAPTKWAEQQQNVVYGVINGGFFDWIINRTQSLICTNGHIHRPNTANAEPQNNIFPTIGTIGVLQDGTFDIQWVYSFKETFQTYSYSKPNAFPGPEPLMQDGRLWNVKQAIGAGPILMKNGSIIKGNLEHFNQTIIGEGLRQPRSGACLDKTGKMILVAIDGRYAESDGLTLEQFGILLQDLGCIDALNLDGGGSSLLYANNQILNHFSDRNPRRVVSAIVIRDRFKKKERPVIKQYQYVNEFAQLKNEKLREQSGDVAQSKFEQKHFIITGVIFILLCISFVKKSKYLESQGEQNYSNSNKWSEKKISRELMMSLKAQQQKPSKLVIADSKKSKTLIIMGVLSLLFGCIFIGVNFALPQKYFEINSRKQSLEKTSIKNCENPNSFNDDNAVICGQLKATNPSLGTVLMNPKFIVQPKTPNLDLQRLERRFRDIPFQLSDYPQIVDLLETKKVIDYMQIFYKCDQIYKCKKVGEGGVGQVYMHPELNVVLKFWKFKPVYEAMINQIMILERINQIWPDYFQHLVFYENKLVGFSMKYFQGRQIWQAYLQKGNILHENPAARVRLVKKLKQITKNLQKLRIGHGDFHIHNILINQKDKTTQDYQLTLLDYGSSFIINERVLQLPQLNGWKFMRPPEAKTGLEYDTRGINPFMFARTALQILLLQTKNQYEKLEMMSDHSPKVELENLTTMGFDPSVRAQIEQLLHAQVEIRHSALMRDSIMKQEVKGFKDSPKTLQIAPVATPQTIQNQKQETQLKPQKIHKEYIKSPLKSKPNSGNYIAYLEVQLNPKNSQDKNSQLRSQSLAKQISQNVTIQIYEVQKVFVNKSNSFVRQTEIPIETKTLSLNEDTLQNGLGYVFLDTQKLYYLKAIFSEYHQFEDQFSPKIVVRIPSSDWTQSVLKIKYILFFMAIIFSIVIFNQSSKKRAGNIENKIVKALLSIIVFLVYPFSGLYQNVHQNYHSLASSLLFAVFMTIFVLHFRALSSEEFLSQNLKNSFSFCGNSVLNLCLLVGFLILKIGSQYLIDIQVIQQQMFLSSIQMTVVAVLLLSVISYNFYKAFTNTRIIQSCQSQKNQTQQERLNLSENFKLISLPMMIATVVYLCISVYQNFSAQSGLNSLQYQITICVYLVSLVYLLSEKSIYENKSFQAVEPDQKVQMKIKQKVKKQKSQLLTPTNNQKITQFQFSNGILVIVKNSKNFLI